MLDISSPPGTRWVPGVAPERSGFSPARPAAADVQDVFDQHNLYVFSVQVPVRNTLISFG